MSAEGVSHPFKRPWRVTLLFGWNHSPSPARQTVRQTETDPPLLHHACHGGQQRSKPRNTEQHIRHPFNAGGGEELNRFHFSWGPKTTGSATLLVWRATSHLSVGFLFLWTVSPSNVAAEEQTFLQMTHLPATLSCDVMPVGSGSRCSDA